MIRYMLGLSVFLSCAVLAAADAPPPPLPPKYSWPSTCSGSMSPPMRFMTTHSRADLIAARQPVADFVASLDVYAACLDEALAALEESRRKAGHQVDPRVQQAVAVAVADVPMTKGIFIGYYDSAVAQYDASLAAGEDPLPALDIPPLRPLRMGHCRLGLPFCRCPRMP